MTTTLSSQAAVTDLVFSGEPTCCLTCQHITYQVSALAHAFSIMSLHCASQAGLAAHYVRMVETFYVIWQSPD